MIKFVAFVNEFENIYAIKTERRIIINKNFSASDRKVLLLNEADLELYFSELIHAIKRNNRLE